MLTYFWLLDQANRLKNQLHSSQVRKKCYLSNPTYNIFAGWSNPALRPRGQPLSLLSTDMNRSIKYLTLT